MASAIRCIEEAIEWNLLLPKSELAATRFSNWTKVQEKMQEENQKLLQRSQTFADELQGQLITLPLAKVLSLFQKSLQLNVISLLTSDFCSGRRITAEEEIVADNEWDDCGM